MGSGIAKTTSRIQMRAAPSGKGKAHHPAVYEWRRKPDGYIRLQTRSGAAARPDAWPEREARRPDGRSGCGDEEPVRIQAAWSDGAVGEQRLSASGQMGG